MSEALPDTATTMTRVGECWWHLIYGARGGNWELADYYLRRTLKLDKTLATLRPAHAERLARLQQAALPSVIAAIGARDPAALESAYKAATDIAGVGLFRANAFCGAACAGGRCLPAERSGAVLRCRPGRGTLALSALIVVLTPTLAVVAIGVLGLVTSWSMNRWMPRRGERGAPP